MLLLHPINLCCGFFFTCVKMFSDVLFDLLFGFLVIIEIASQFVTIYFSFQYVNICFIYLCQVHIYIFIIIIST